MSAFGLSYAAYVALVGGSLVAFDPPPQTPTEAQQTTWQYGWGKNDISKAPVGQDGLLTIEYRPNTEWFWRLKPLYGVGLTTDGAGYLTAAVRKDFRFGPVQVSPYFGPALYQSDFGNLRASELIQFRTGFDVSMSLTPKVALGLGYFHISNAGLTKASGELDVTRLTLQYKY